MEKYVNYSGFLTILLLIGAIVFSLVPMNFDAGLFYTLAVVVMAFIFTPLFFINHKKVFNAYKVPCYTASALVGILLMFGSLLAGITQTFGEPNFYTGGFMVLCYLVVILLFKPPSKHSIIVVATSVLMIGSMLTTHLLDGTI